MRFIYICVNFSVNEALILMEIIIIIIMRLIQAAGDDERVLKRTVGPWRRYALYRVLLQLPENAAVLLLL